MAGMCTQWVRSCVPFGQDRSYSFPPWRQGRSSHAVCRMENDLPGPVMQNRITRDDILFSLKSFAAAMLALYLAFRLGLPRPFWSLISAYVVSQPFSGTTRSKAVYRVAGTVAGAVLTVLVVPRFVGYPVLLALIFSAWIGVCLYVSLLDRTPRAYAFMLAGYSVPIIALPILADVSQFSEAMLFEASLARVEEIVLGIVCSALVHSLVLPKGIDRTALERLDVVLRDVRQWVWDILSDNSGNSKVELHRLSQTISELRTLVTHLSFDTSNVRWIVGLVTELQNRFSTLLPVLATVRDRLEVIRREENGVLPEAWQKVLLAMRDWIGTGDSGDMGRVVVLQKEIDRIMPVIRPGAGMREMMYVNLGMELQRLLNEGERCFDLRRQIDEGMAGKTPPIARRPVKTSAVSLFVDRRIALVSALAAGLAQGLSCLFWMVSGWPNGVSVPVNAGIYCMFFASLDNPLPAIRLQFIYITLSTLTAGLYLLLLLPSAHSFEMLMLVFAPFLLLMNILMVKPATAMRATPFMMLTICSMTMFDTGTADMTTFINTELSQSIGIGMSLFCTWMFRVVNVTAVTRRLARYMWGDIAQLGDASRVPSMIAMSVKMVDGISLLVPRLTQLEKPRHLAVSDGLSANGILSDLCIGLNMARLLRLERRLATSGVRVRPLLGELASYYREKAAGRPVARERIRGMLDDLLAQTADMTGGSLQKMAVSALSGIWRDLFLHEDIVPDMPGQAGDGRGRMLAAGGQ